jgi:O-antigen/teichoic acid export membrane protein
MGVIQGEQRFSTLALVTVVPFGVRLVVLAAVAVVGATLVGTVTAIAVAGVAASAVSFIPVRRLFRHPSVSITPSISLRAFSRYLLPVLVGLLAITLIVNIDVIVVNARFADADAGVYAAAAAFGRVGYFLPGTILTVLFPRTAARQARGEQTDDILGRSLIVTAGFCVLLAAFYWTVGGPLVRVSFGQDFANAADLLPLFALEMMFVSAANVLVGFHLSRNESRFAWIAAATVPVQIVLLATVPDTLRGVVWTNIIVGVGLLGVHELAIGSSLPALRAGMRRFRRQPDGLD